MGLIIEEVRDRLNGIGILRNITYKVADCHLYYSPDNLDEFCLFFLHTWPRGI